MLKKQSIPPEIQEKVHNLIDEFNQKQLKETTNLLNAFFLANKNAVIQRASIEDIFTWIASIVASLCLFAA